MEILQRHLSHFKEISSLFCTYLPFQDYKFVLNMFTCSCSIFLEIFGFQWIQLLIIFLAKNQKY